MSNAHPVNVAAASVAGKFSFKSHHFPEPLDDPPPNVEPIPPELPQPAPPLPDPVPGDAPIRVAAR